MLDHAGFAVADAERPRAFQEQALAAGGRGNGTPGLKPRYHLYHYGAFVLGPRRHQRRGRLATGPNKRPAQSAALSSLARMRILRH